MPLAQIRNPDLPLWMQMKDAPRQAEEQYKQDYYQRQKDLTASLETPDMFSDPETLINIFKALTLGLGTIGVKQGIKLLGKKPQIIREVFGKSVFPTSKVDDIVTLRSGIKGKVISVDKYGNRRVEYSISMPVKSLTKEDKLSNKIDLLDDRIEKAESADYPNDDLIEKLIKIKEKLEEDLSRF